MNIIVTDSYDLREQEVKFVQGVVGIYTHDTELN